MKEMLKYLLVLASYMFTDNPICKKKSEENKKEAKMGKWCFFGPEVELMGCASGWRELTSHKDIAFVSAMTSCPWFLNCKGLE